MTKYSEWTNRLVTEKRLADAHKLKDGFGKKLGVQNGSIVDGPPQEKRKRDWP